MIVPSTTPRLACVLLIVACSIHAYSTTAIVMVGDHGIAFAIDSKIVLATTNLSRREIVGERAGIKYAIIQDRIVIADIGYEVFRIVDPRSGALIIEYDFGTWVHRIESSLPADVSFDDFVQTVNHEFRQMLPKLQNSVNAGVLHQKNADDIFESPIEYVIMGYQNGIPRLSIVEFYIDWDTKLVIGPYQVPFEPNGPIAGHTRLYTFGITDSIREFFNPQSYAYKQAMAASHNAFDDFISRRPVPINESASIARTLVRIEHEINPGVVGGAFDTIEISPDGRVLALPEDTPKAGIAKPTPAKPKTDQK